MNTEIDVTWLYTIGLRLVFDWAALIKDYRSYQHTALLKNNN